jgi:hypothetical protein
VLRRHAPSWLAQLPSLLTGVERALKAADADPKLLKRGLIPWLAGIDPDTSSPRRRIARPRKSP